MQIRNYFIDLKYNSIPVIIKSTRLKSGGNPEHPERTEKSYFQRLTKLISI